MTYFAQLPFELLQELLYYMPIRELDNAFEPDGFFGLPEFSHLLDNDKIWTRLCKRDFDPELENETVHGYIERLDKLGNEQQSFIESLIDSGSNLVKSYIDTNLFWKVSMFDVLKHAIFQEKLSVGKYVFEQFAWSDEEKKLIIKTILDKIKQHQGVENVSIFAYLFPLVLIPDSSLIKELYDVTFVHGLLNVFELLIDNNYTFEEQYLYKFTVGYWLPASLDKFLKILLGKNLKLDLDKILNIAIMSGNLDAVNLAYKAGGKITDELIKITNNEKMKTYLRSLRSKKRRLE